MTALNATQRKALERLTVQHCPAMDSDGPFDLPVYFLGSRDRSGVRYPTVAKLVELGLAEFVRDEHRTRIAGNTQGCPMIDEHCWLAKITEAGREELAR